MTVSPDVEFAFDENMQTAPNQRLQNIDCLGNESLVITRGVPA